MPRYNVLNGPSKLRVVRPRNDVLLGNDWRLQVNDASDSTKVRFTASGRHPAFNIEKARTNEPYLLIRSIPFEPGVLNEIKYQINASKRQLIERVELLARDATTGTWSRHVDLTATTIPHWIGYIVDRFSNVDALELVIKFSRRKGLASIVDLDAKVLRALLAGDGGAALPVPTSSLKPQPKPDSHPLLHYLMGAGESHHHTHPLFDDRWYTNQLSDALPEGMTPLQHYIAEGDAAGLSPHPLFHPSFYRSQATGILPSENALIHYLAVGIAAGFDPHPLFRSKWYLGQQDRLAFEKARKTLLDSFRTPGDFFSQNSRIVSEALPTRDKPTPRIVVYTCMFGAYESLKPIRQPQHGVRYIAFTDDSQLKSEDWEVVVVNDRLASTRRTSRLPKILAHRYLPDHDISLYIDGSLTLVAEDVNAMVLDCLGERDIALYRHHRRDCVYDEMAICLELGLERSSEIEWYTEHYNQLGVARHAGLYENTLIVRRNTADIRRLNDLWWASYIGERDQLSLMSAIIRTSTDVASIAKGRQVRNNPYVTFTKHTRTALQINEPRIYAFVAYAPAGYGQDLGRAYNDYMELVKDDDIVVFLDHDAMFCSDDWYGLIARFAVNLGDRPYMIIGRTNRIGNPYQRLGAFQDSHDIRDHAVVSSVLVTEEGDWATNVGQLNSSSGVILAMKKSTWRQHKFTSGFLKVDNQIHISFRDMGRPVYMPSALYAYHFYRADGDTQHAVKIDAGATLNRSTDLQELHAVRNCIYNESAGLDLAHYAGILHDDQFALFLRSDSMMCDKRWYPSAEKMTQAHIRLSDATLWVFANNLTDPKSPSSDDVLAHRAYASDMGRSRRARVMKNVTGDDLVSFMCSAGLLKRYVSEGGKSVAGFRDFVRNADIYCRREPSIYVYTQNRQVGGSLCDLTAFTATQAIIRGGLRVAILTLGFWPAQAGMEMMIHNLATHLSKMGDDVVLFTPRPEIEFVEIEHEYLLKRYKNERDLESNFIRYHDALPFDVLLVQGGYKAAQLALRLKTISGVPVVLRTHGEDIQTDRDTGYGYRLDPIKREIIDTNIRLVDRNVVIGDHIAPLIREIAPNAEVRTIYNGVDTDRFIPRRTKFLHERLGLPSSARILITVGRNVKKKTFHLALQAFQQVLHEFPDVVLVHVGKEGNGEDLAGEADRLGIAHAFYMTGALDYFDTPLAYASAEIFVFPSKVETFGNVTLEAMSAGLPCVEFDYGANRAKILDGETGFIIPHGDIAGMADALKALLENDQLRTAFSIRAREHAKDKFSWPVVARHYHRVFDEVRSARKASARAISALGSRRAAEGG